MIKTALCGILYLFLAACVSSTAERIGSTTYQPLPSLAEVKVFTGDSQVTQPFTVIGTISYTNPGKYQVLSLGDVIEPLREKARELGANGVIVDHYEPVKSGIISTGIAVQARAILLSGIASLQPPQGSAAVPQPAPKDPEEALRQLRKLHDDGLINDQEYEAKKADILRRM